MSVFAPIGAGWAIDDWDATAAPVDIDGDGLADVVEFTEPDSNPDSSESDAEGETDLTATTVAPVLPTSVTTYLADLIPAIDGSSARALVDIEIASIAAEPDFSAPSGETNISSSPAADPVDPVAPPSGSEAMAPNTAALIADDRLIWMPTDPEIVDDGGGTDVPIEDIDGDGVGDEADPGTGDGYGGSDYSYDYSGSWSFSAGDVNGDGFDDHIVNTYEYADGSYISSTFVVFGAADGSLPVDDVAEIDGSNGFRIEGGGADGYGPTLAAAGDVNGDGFADLIATTYGPGGACYVVFGNAGGQAAVDVASLDGSNGFRIDGLVSDAYSSWWATAAGDVNGDGFDDLIIDTFTSDASGAYSQASYVILGSAAGFAAAIDIAALDGTNGYLIEPEVPPEPEEEPDEYVFPDDEILPDWDILPVIGDEDIVYGRPVWTKDPLEGDVVPGEVSILPVCIMLTDADFLS